MSGEGGAAPGVSPYPEPHSTWAPSHTMLQNGFRGGGMGEAAGAGFGCLHWERWDTAPYGTLWCRSYLCITPSPAEASQPHKKSPWGHWAAWGCLNPNSNTNPNPNPNTNPALLMLCCSSADEEPCIGDQRQYRLCQLQVSIHGAAQHSTAPWVPHSRPYCPIVLSPQGCPGGSVPFRAMQCSLYDDTPVQGMQTRHRWVPFYGGEPQGVGAPSGALMPPTTGVPSFPLALQPPTSVTSTAWLWGTTSTTPLAACWTAPAAGPAPRICASVGAAWWVCVGMGPPPSTGPRPCPDITSLLLQSVGCDGILGTGAQPRVCSRCGGGQDGCLFVHRLFQDTEPFSGE